MKQILCSNCGRPIHLAPTRAKNVVMRKLTLKERRRIVWRHMDDEFMHCRLSVAVPE